MPIQYHNHLQECKKHDHVAPQKAKPKRNIKKTFASINNKLVEYHHRASIKKTTSQPVAIKPHKRNYKKMRDYRKTHTVCEACLSTTPKMTHHLTPVSKGGTEEETNYKALCFDCHDAVHPELPDGLKKRWREGIPATWHK